MILLIIEAVSVGVDVLELVLVLLLLDVLFIESKVELLLVEVSDREVRFVCTFNELGVRLVGLGDGEIIDEEDEFEFVS